MSVTGIALILFLTFHASMNVVALISAKGYNMICEFLGANWYAVAATIGLAALVVLHFVYAFWLTVQNRRARGDNRYEVTNKPEKVEWASQNMLVLGIIVILGMGLHLYNFWYNMMFAELAGIEGKIAPADGAGFIAQTFACPCYTALYIVWLAALWFHLSHGFWSALQTLGWNGKVWFQRWRCIGNTYVTIVVLMFAVVAVAFTAGYKPADFDSRNDMCFGPMPIEGKCPLLDKCPKAEGMCPKAGNKCPKAEGMCPKAGDKCPMAEGRCPMAEEACCGKCDKAEGKCCTECQKNEGECCGKCDMAEGECCGECEMAEGECCDKCRQ